MAISLPTAAQISEIAQDLLPRLTADRLGLQIMPIENDDIDIVMWEQEDNYKGLQQVRGLGGDPKRVKKTGATRYMYAPGYYGEFEELDEMELTRRRRYGSFGASATVDDLVGKALRKLLGRRLDRVESIIFTLLTTGTFTVPTAGESGVPGGAQYAGSYSVQTFSAGTAWSNHASSTPLADMRAMALLHRGHSVDFGPSAMLLLNRVWINHLLANTNTADFGGLRDRYGATLNDIDARNRIFAGQGIPQVMEYDEGYVNESGTWTPFIADSVGLLVGRRSDGSKVGAYKMTRNMNNPDGAPGAYTKIIDRGAPGPGEQVPRKIEVHDGHNGGPAIWYPSAIVRAAL